MEKNSNYRRFTAVLPQSFSPAKNKLNFLFYKFKLKEVSTPLKSYFLLFLFINFILFSFYLYQLFQSYQIVKIQREEKLKEAKFWEQITQKNPNYPDAFYKTAIDYYILGDNKKALSLLDEALYLDPNFKEVERLKDTILR